MARNLDDFYIFCQVVRLGSMKAASEELEIPLSTVSRRIANLEESVSSPLFVRSKTALKPTNTGLHYYQRLSPHFTSLYSELDTLDSDLNEVTGKVSIDCTDFVYDYFLKSGVEELLLKYPNLKLKFIPSRDTTSFHPDADLAILAGELPDSNLVVKRLVSIDMQVVANTQLKPVPLKLQDLKELPFIGHLQQQRITGYDRHSRALESINLYPKLSLSEPDAVAEMACKGVGFAFVPNYFVDDSLKSGELVEWLTDYDFGQRETYLGYRHRTQKSRAQEVVIEMIERCFDKFNQ
ncbi:transcriptional regulator, lysR family [Vibrio ishigakensis]|uniref:Transcriptional regulator, lysR family n=1 Tax=Vibrio ishigakensis TaxID=1481914 RepID=A0A0B8NYX8_9VIBR|nr:LysR family transcriptional regulator [Vibrio ishigakensis]GAM59760.1 transcriptional regulator, lysR family [Vibrio ishigakensis]